MKLMLAPALRECVEMWMYAGAIGSKSLSSQLFHYYYNYTSSLQCPHSSLFIMFAQAAIGK